MSDVAIRPAEERDRAAIVDLIHALNLHEATLCADRRTDFAAAQECYDAVRARIARDGGALFMACSAQDEPLGFISLAFATDEPFVREALRRYGMVTDLVVAPAHRGAGIGRRLIAAAEERVREEGVARLQIGVLAANEDAAASYRAAGYGPHMLMLEKYL
jgi:ribosomal protein S18 acetylase RimI-like enzyme